MRELLAQPWPKERNPEALRNRCIKALQHPEVDSSEFGMPEKEQEIVWEALADLARSGFGHGRQCHCDA